MIYLDYAASTPVDKDVLENFIEVTEKYYANPNSSHSFGLDGSKLIDSTTFEISTLLNVKPEEIIYTSGATESNNLAIWGIANRYKNKGRHILVSALEHNSILSSITALSEQGFEVSLIPIEKDGRINLHTLEKMLRDDTILVSITSVDSELGIVQPIEEIGKLLKEKRDIVFHTDASQSIGKVSIDYSTCDLITITPHKFYGLSGISILVKKNNVSIKPMILGGKSTTIYRSGTPNTALISSSLVSIKKALEDQEKNLNHINNLNKLLIKELSKNKNIVINSTINSIPHIVNISIKDTKSNIIVNFLNDKSIMVSGKTSCCPTNTPSKLVYALTHDKKLANSSIRISLSHLTKENEIYSLIDALKEITCDK